MNSAIRNSSPRVAFATCALTKFSLSFHSCNVAVVGNNSHLRRCISTSSFHTHDFSSGLTYGSTQVKWSQLIYDGYNLPNQKSVNLQIRKSSFNSDKYERKRLRLTYYLTDSVPPKWLTVWDCNMNGVTTLTHHPCVISLGLPLLQPQTVQLKLRG